MISKFVHDPVSFLKICRHVAATLGVLLVISGCGNTDRLGGKAFAQSTNVDTKTVTVKGTKIVLGRAAGYCFEDKPSKSSGSGAFVVMMPCDSKAEDNEAKGLVLVTILAKSGVKDALQAHKLEVYLRSKAGRAALSQKGQADRVEILGTMQEKGLVFVHTKDADGPIIPDTTDEQWRIFFVANDRLISVSIVNFTDHLMPDGLIFAQIEAISQRIKQLNP